MLKIHEKFRVKGTGFFDLYGPDIDAILSL